MWNNFLLKKNKLLGTYYLISRNISKNRNYTFTQPCKEIQCVLTQHSYREQKKNHAMWIQIVNHIWFCTTGTSIIIPNFLELLNCKILVVRLFMKKIVAWIPCRSRTLCSVYTYILYLIKIQLPNVLWNSNLCF